MGRVRLLLPAVRAAVRAAEWVDAAGADRAAVTLAETLAAEIDRLQHPDQGTLALLTDDIQSTASKLAYISNTLQTVLAGLRLTPATRPEALSVEQLDPIIRLKAAAGVANSPDRHTA